MKRPDDKPTGSGSYATASMPQHAATTQTFRAANVAAALEEVQRELGPDAVVISVRQVPPGPVWQVWRAPEIEVVAMPEGEKAAPQTSAAGKNSPADSSVAQALREALREAQDGARSETRPPAQPAHRQPASSSPPARFPAAAGAAAYTGGAEKPPNPTGRSSAAQETALEEAVQALTKALSQSRSRLNKAGPNLPLPADPAGETPAEVQEEMLKPPAQPALPDALVRIFSRLMSQGVDEGLARKLTKTCVETLAPRALADEARLRTYLEQQLQASLRSRPESALEGDRVICLIGLSGSGKTSVCAKLATKVSIQARLENSPHHGRKVIWVCADTVSTGAISEARMYTETLGLPLHMVYNSDELARVVETELKQEKYPLILVDTPGCNPYKESSIVELGDLLTALPHRSTYLVAPATGKEADLARALAAFKAFNLKGLVVTRLDETGTYGNIYNLAWRSQLPLTYFSTGRRVPDDLQPAQGRQLVSALFGEGWTR